MSSGLAWHHHRLLQDAIGASPLVGLVVSRLDLLAGERLADAPANTQAPSNLQTLRRKPDLNRDSSSRRPSDPRQSGGRSRARTTMNTTQSTKPMIKLSNTGPQKTQGGSDPIEVRAGFAENNQKPQRQSHLGSVQTQSRNRSQEMNDPAATKAITSQTTQAPDRGSRFRPSNQNPTALNQNRQTAFSANRP